MRLRVIPGGIALVLAGCGLSAMGTSTDVDAGAEAGVPLVIDDAAIAAPDASADPPPPDDAAPIPPADAAPDVIVAPACIKGTNAPTCACGAGGPCPAGSTECSSGKCIGTLTVTVSIDGRSDLHLKGAVVTWRHDKHAAPGVTTLNGTPWTPTWPQTDPRDCQCTSSNSATVTPALPARLQTVGFTKTAGREGANLREQPSILNDYEAVVRIDDDVSGSDNYVFTLTYETR